MPVLALGNIQVNGRASSNYNILITSVISAMTHSVTIFAIVRKPVMQMKYCSTSLVECVTIDKRLSDAKRFYYR